jgi:hypothetical protein
VTQPEFEPPRQVRISLLLGSSFGIKFWDLGPRLVANLKTDGGLDALFTSDDRRGHSGHSFHARTIHRHPLLHQLIGHRVGGRAVDLDTDYLLGGETQGTEGGLGLAVGLLGRPLDRLILGRFDRLIAGDEGHAIDAGGSGFDDFIEEGADRRWVDLEPHNVGALVADDRVLAVFIFVGGVEGCAVGVELFDGFVFLEEGDDRRRSFGDIGLGADGGFALDFDAELDLGEGLGDVDRALSGDGEAAGHVGEAGGRAEVAAGSEAEGEAGGEDQGGGAGKVCDAHGIDRVWDGSILVGRSAIGRLVSFFATLGLWGWLFL